MKTLSNGFLGLMMLVRTAFALGLIVLSLGGTALAGSVRAPEIDAGSMATALTLISGAVLVVTNRARRK